MAAAIPAPIRFFIGGAGPTFVTNQFWRSLMFAPSVVGTANATSAAWGNLGGGVTQIFMMSVLLNPMMASGLKPKVAWRVGAFHVSRPPQLPSQRHISIPEVGV